MRNVRKQYQNKNNTLLKVFFHKSFPVLLVVLVVFVGIAYSRELIRSHKINKEIATMENEMVKIKGENSTIFDNIQYYKTLAYLEKEARVKLGKCKDGEKMIVIEDVEGSVGNVVDTNDEIAINENNKTNPYNWFCYFFCVNEQL